MRKLLLALALFLTPALAHAQCTGVFPANSLCGNLTASPAPPSAFTASGTVVGPGSSTVGDAAVWNNTSGTLLKDVPFLQVYGTQSANTVFAGPTTGAAAFPTWRAQVNADIPTALSGKTIDNSVIGGTTPAAGTFTTLNTSGVITQTLANPGAGENAITSLDATMAATNQVLAILGRDNSTNDRATFAFRYSGLNSANNHGWLGLFGSDGAIIWDGNGNVGLGTGTSTTLDKAFAVRSDNNFSVDSSGNVLLAGSISSTGGGNLTLNAAGSFSILAVGGTNVVAASSGSFIPSTDNTIALGGGSNRWASLNVAGVATVASATATPAGGSTAARLLFGTTSGFGIYYGSGVPTVSAAQGSLYLRSDGAGGATRAYINTNGTTGWTSITTGS